MEHLPVAAEATRASSALAPAPVKAPAELSDRPGATALLARRDELPSTVVWRASFVADANRVSYCEWDSPDGRLLQEIFEAFGVPYSSVHEVRVFEPAAMLSHAA